MHLIKLFLHYRYSFAILTQTNTDRFHKFHAYRIKCLKFIAEYT